VTSSQLPLSGDVDGQSCACPKPNLAVEVVGSRIVSWSRYFDEISRIGANGTSVASFSTPDAELTRTIDPIVATGGESKVHTLANGEFGVPIQEENPRQTCESSHVDSNANLKDLNKNTGVTGSVQPSTHIGLGSGEGLQIPGLFETSGQEESAVPNTTASQVDCRDGTLGTKSVEQSSANPKTTDSPSPKRTKSNNGTKLCNTSKIGTQGKERKAFINPGLAGVSEVAENGAVSRANSQAKGLVSKQRSHGRVLNKKDGSIVMTGEKK
jgi:hypothetical protein